MTEIEMKAKAFDELLELFGKVLEDFEYERELLDMDMRDGERGVGISRKCIELRTKIKLMSEIICFTEQTLEYMKEEAEGRTE